MRLEEFVAGGVAITDGAWGTEMQTRGLAPGEPPDAWNLLRPEQVEEVARAYVDAGSQVILTNTFQSTAVALDAHGLSDRASEINRKGAEISRRASAGRAKVFGSMGPAGKLLIAGEISPQALRQAFLQQAEALAEGGVDALLIETMSALDEAVIALEAAKSTGLPVIVSFAFDSGKNKDRTMMGVTPEQAALEMTAAGADAVGANCGAGIETFAGICRRMRQATSLPLWMKPNAGLPVMEGGRPVYRTAPHDFAAQALGLVEAGASFIGGCCGSNPEFIRALSAALVR